MKASDLLHCEVHTQQAGREKVQAKVLHTRNRTLKDNSGL